MIVYFDTSAFVPLLIDEPSSRLCRRLWEDADHATSTRLLYVETAAALAQAERMERVTADEHLRARDAVDQLWEGITVIEPDGRVVQRAARLASLCALRGYDAVHCASADSVQDSTTVVASGDRKLLAAVSALGMTTVDVNAPA